MSGIVVDGFAAAITASAAYLLAQMDPDMVRSIQATVDAILQSRNLPVVGCLA